MSDISTKIRELSRSMLTMSEKYDEVADEINKVDHELTTGNLELSKNIGAYYKAVEDHNKLLKDLEEREKKLTKLQSDLELKSFDLSKREGKVQSDERALIKSAVIDRKRKENLDQREKKIEEEQKRIQSMI